MEEEEAAKREEGGDEAGSEAGGAGGLAFGETQMFDDWPAETQAFDDAEGAAATPDPPPVLVLAGRSLVRNPP